MEVHKSANTDHDHGASHRYTTQCLVIKSHIFKMENLFCHCSINGQVSFSVDPEGSADNSINLSGIEDIVSLSDIVPETNIVSVNCMSLVE